MNAQEIKEYIYNHDKIEDVLQALDMHHIKKHIQPNNIYYTCGMPDGDNISSTVIYCTSMYNVTAYTRNITDKYGTSDIISLVCFVHQCYFYEGLQWLCSVLDINLYQRPQSTLPKSLQITKMLLKMNGMTSDYAIEYLQPIPEKVLSYYYPVGNIWYKQEGISYQTQKEFEIGYDYTTNRITIPIRDELGTLVGVKGRLCDNITSDIKYLYLESCAKSHILYGLHKTMPYIKQLQQVIIVESEKSVLKLWEHGVCNAVAIGGHQLSKIQIEKLIRLGTSEIILCYDEDVYKYTMINNEQVRNDNDTIINMYRNEIQQKFISQQTVSVMLDTVNILGYKTSPADDINVFNTLYHKRKYIQQYIGG